ncbi:MAG: hypothetical protein JW795_01135 [Chitinivibrionales bacterium]|nr:hypothetical protein [Chitinivibrionales bacterium]
MECNKWNESGLLFCSGELNKDEMDAFAGHIESCSICQSEIQMYRSEQQKFFSAALLEDEPSEAIDAEIIRVCSQRVKPSVHTALFSTYLKRATVPLLLLLVGFAGGIYFISLKSDISTVQNQGSFPQTVTPHQKHSIPSATPVVASAAAATDSNIHQNDSTVENQDSGKATIQRRGNLSDHGVYPVDLKEDQ